MRTLILSLGCGLLAAAGGFAKTDGPYATEIAAYDAILAAELEKCEFKGLLAEVRAEAGSAPTVIAPTTPATVASHAQGELF